MFCAYTRPIYQVSVYRTIRPLVFFILMVIKIKCDSLWFFLWPEFS